MDEFRVISRLWPAGTEINDGSIDSNPVLGGYNPVRVAPQHINDGSASNYDFLFWNTGRHITSKRRVRWNFSVLGWGVWTATRWYGIPGDGGVGSQRVHAEAFTIGGDAPLGPTPINGGASSFAPGAYPFNGNDKEIGTANAAVTVVPQDPLAGLRFAGWMQLLWGGDPTGEFVESDAGTTGGFGDNSFYTNVAPGPFNVVQHGAADLIASYGRSSGTSIPIKDLVDILVAGGSLWDIIWQVGDPVPPDLTRGKILEELIARTRPGQVRTNPAAGGAGDFQRLIQAAPNMSQDELKRALSSLQTTLDMGKSAAAALEAQMKKAPK